MAEITTRMVLDRLGDQVAQIWGEPARVDLEMRTGLVPELVAARRSLDEQAWTEAVREFLAGPRPRQVASGLLAVLRRTRRRKPAARAGSREVVAGHLREQPRPSPDLTPYQKALLRLVPCDGSPKMQ